jgi:putative oxidoreductase
MDIDLGLLVIRLALGPMLVAHGANRAFGPGGLTGTEGWFAALGLRPVWLHARLAAATEITAGTLLMLGLLTPAAAFVGLMLVATLTDHRGKGYFVFKGGWEFTVLVAMAAVGLAATGPGDWSLDHALGLDLAGAAWAEGVFVVGLLAAAGLLAACHPPQPVHARRLRELSLISRPDACRSPLSRPSAGALGCTNARFLAVRGRPRRGIVGEGSGSPSR